MVFDVTDEYLHRDLELVVNNYFPTSENSFAFTVIDQVFGTMNLDSAKIQSELYSVSSNIKSRGIKGLRVVKFTPRYYDIANEKVTYAMEASELLYEDLNGQEQVEPLNKPLSVCMENIYFDTSVCDKDLMFRLGLSREFNALADGTVFNEDQLWCKLYYDSKGRSTIIGVADKNVVLEGFKGSIDGQLKELHVERLLFEPGYSYYGLQGRVVSDCSGYLTNKRIDGKVPVDSLVFNSDAIRNLDLMLLNRPRSRMKFLGGLVLGGILPILGATLMSFNIPNSRVRDAIDVPNSFIELYDLGVDKNLPIDLARDTLSDLSSSRNDTNSNRTYDGSQSLRYNCYLLSSDNGIDSYICPILYGDHPSVINKRFFEIYGDNYKDRSKITVLHKDGKPIKLLERKGVKVYDLDREEEKVLVRVER